MKQAQNRPHQKLSNEHSDKCTQVEHHFSIRQRLGKDDFNFIDKLVVFAGPLIPVAVFVQAYNVWWLDKVDGLSLFTWSVLLFASLTMATYALHHFVKPLMLTYVPLVLAHSLVVSGIIIKG